MRQSSSKAELLDCGKSEENPRYHTEPFTRYSGPQEKSESSNVFDEVDR